MYVKAFIINVNRCPKPFFLEQHIDIVNKSHASKLLVDQYMYILGVNRSTSKCLIRQAFDLILIFLPRIS